jgi:His/Glu/Gln/Arg/opine family amino acid ABC transporter permease subunit
MLENFNAILPSMPYIMMGVIVTIKFTVVSLMCGLPLGTLLALAKISDNRNLNRFAAIYTSIFRGTPLLVQLGLVFWGLPEIIGLRLSTFEAGVLTFSLNSAAYTSEIIRAGIESIPAGQWESAKVLGLSYRETFLKIVLPQAIRNILPALVNETVDLLKESALVSVIGEPDLLKRAQNVASEKFLYFEPILMAAVGYYCMVMVISTLAKLLERKMRYA